MRHVALLICSVALLCQSLVFPQSASAGDEGVGPRTAYRLRFVSAFNLPLSKRGSSAAIFDVGFSRDGRLLACYWNCPQFIGSGNVCVWHVRTGECLLDMRPRGWMHWHAPADWKYEPRDYVFVPTPSPKLCFQSSFGLSIREDLNSDCERHFSLSSFSPETEIMPQSVFLSDDERFVAVVLRDRKELGVWSLATGKLQHLFPLPVESCSSIRAVAFDSKARYIAAAVDEYVSEENGGGLLVWDIKAGKLVLETHDKYRGSDITFAPDGDLLTAGGARCRPGRVTVRHRRDYAEGRNTFASLYAPAHVWTVVYIPGKGILTGDARGQVMLWDKRSGWLLAASEEGIERSPSIAQAEYYLGPAILAIAVHGSLVAAGDAVGEVRMWRIIEQTNDSQTDRKP